MNRWMLAVFAVAVLLVADAFAKQRRSFRLNPSQFETDGSECNVYDDVHVCKMVTVDATTYKTETFQEQLCDCPLGWYCPDSPLDTVYQEQCARMRQRRNTFLCQMKCVPKDSFTRYADKRP